MEKKEKLVIEGNAFYELDLVCVEEKENLKRRRMQKDTPKNRNGGNLSNDESKKRQRK